MFKSIKKFWPSRRCGEIPRSLNRPRRYDWVCRIGVMGPKTWLLAQKFLDMLGEDVDLNVDSVAGSGDSQSRHGQRVGNQHDGECIGPDVDQRKADPVDGDRSL